jgi:hypothetical protein
MGLEIIQSAAFTLPQVPKVIVVDCRSLYAGKNYSMTSLGSWST